MKPQTYRFYFDLGAPVFDWPTGKKMVSTKWRKSKRTIPAHSLTEAVRKLAKNAVTKYGAKAQLRLYRAFCHTESDCVEINLDTATLAAFIVGTQERELLNLP